MPYHHLVLLSLKFGPSKRTVISFFPECYPYNRSVIILFPQVHIVFAHFALLIRSVVILVKISKAIDLINNYSFIESISSCKNLTQQSKSQNQILFPTEGNFLSCLRSSGKVLYNNVSQRRPNSKDTFLVTTLVKEEN